MTELRPAPPTTSSTSRHILAVVRRVYALLGVALVAGSLAIWWGVENLYESLVTGLIAAVIWAAMALAFRAFQRIDHFGGLEGAFSVTEKGKDRPSPEVVTNHPNGNVLEVSFNNVRNNGSVEGQIHMSDQFPTSGTGHYDHVKWAGEDREEQLWGFWTIQVKNDDTILVHTTYTDNYAEKVVGYVWNRVRHPP